MIILEENKIIRFRDRLYRKNVPGILKSGAKDLNPMEKSKADGQGNPIVLTNEIISFFFSAMGKEDGLNADQYISNLYRVFDILAKEAQHYSFQSDMRVSEKDIEEADLNLTIELLTKNLIITYFSRVKLSDGSVTHDLLDPDLEAVIKLSNEGRDYRTLIGKVLDALVETLKSAKPWRQSLEEIEKASLVCWLVGAGLPQIEKTVLSRIVSEFRAEIKKDTAFFTKILNTKDRLTKEEKNHKNFVKAMDKLDQALAGILKNIDDCLGHAYRCIAVIGASIHGFLGQVDEELKKNTAALFFEYGEEVDEKHQIKVQRSFSSYRYRMAMLFDYPGLTKFSKSLQREERYRDWVLDCFRLYFDEFIRQMDFLFSPAGPKDFKLIETRLFEIIRLVRNLELDPLALESEKKKIQEKYLSLLSAIPLEYLSSAVLMKEDICIAIQDHSKTLMEAVRKTLMETCHARLTALDPESISFDELHQAVQKLLTGYALSYKPQRFFYQRFFEQYISGPNGALSLHMTQLLQKKRPIALKMLEIFSDPKYVGDFISKDQIAFSDELLKKFLEK